ncbi:rhodanese-like domain-containing protein [bacterium]|jgi:rhodanese-related sulfurtransferase|nr:rhodanese-like domain-containing protein [bacterium]
MKSLYKQICKFYVVAGFFAIIFASCGGPSHKKDEFLLIDVSFKDVFSDCHINGAVNIPFDKVEIKARKLNKDGKVVLYCTNYECTSSLEAAKILKRKGFKDISVYEGGIAEWHQLGNEGKDFHCNGKCKNAFLSQKIEPHEVEHQDGMAVISAQELKGLLEKYVYDKKTLQEVQK